MPVSSGIANGVVSAWRAMDASVRYGGPAYRHPICRLLQERARGEKARVSTVRKSKANVCMRPRLRGCGCAAAAAATYGETCSPPGPALTRCLRRESANGWAKGRFGAAAQSCSRPSPLARTGHVARDARRNLVGVVQARVDVHGQASRIRGGARRRAHFVLWARQRGRVSALGDCRGALLCWDGCTLTTSGEGAAAIVSVCRARGRHDKG